MINSNKLLKYFQILVLIIISLFILSASVRSIRSNAWYFNAMNILKAHDVENYSNEDLNLALKAITLSNEIEPSHPQYLHMLAHIKMLILAKHKHDISSDLPSYYKDIEGLLLTSLSLRETWPETWIALAQVVSYQEGPSERVYEYIQQAKEVGPYNFNVAYGAIQIALSNWHRLPPKFKVLYLNELNLASNHKNKFKSIYSLAEKVNRSDKLCLSLKFGPNFKATRSTYFYKKQCEWK